MNIKKYLIMYIKNPHSKTSISLGCKKLKAFNNKAIEFKNENLFQL